MHQCPLSTSSWCSPEQTLQSLAIVSVLCSRLQWTCAASWHVPHLDLFVKFPWVSLNASTVFTFLPDFALFSSNTCFCWISLIDYFKSWQTCGTVYQSFNGYMCTSFQSQCLCHVFFLQNFPPVFCTFLPACGAAGFPDSLHEVLPWWRLSAETQCSFYCAKTCWKA